MSVTVGGTDPTLSSTAEVVMSHQAVLGDVRTSYERAGAGDPLVLLHPGGVDARVLASLVPGLAATFEVFCPDRRGHGRTPDVAGPISYELMARDTVAFLEQVVGGPAALVGHSDGATVALLTALARPDLVTALVFVSGVFHHDAWALGALDLDEATLDGFREFHAEVSPDGPGAFDVLHAKLDRMHRAEPALTVADLAGYPGPALVMIGDDEDEIPLDHMIALRSGLPDAHLAVVPAAGHGLPLDRPELFTLLVAEFVLQVPARF